jgi:ankyrin repeat protein
MTALDISCKYGFHDIATVLVDKAKIETLLNPNKEGSPLYLACKNKKENLAIVKKILDRLKNEQEALNDDSIHYANDILKKLDNNQTVLSISINNNHLNIVELLLKEHFKCITSIEDKNGNSLIHLAAKNGSPDLLKLLIKHNAFSMKLNKNNDSPLHIAAANNKFNFIKEFLAYEKVYMERSHEEKETSATSILTTMSSTDSTDSHSNQSYIPSIKRVNKNEHTPLFVAVVSGHLKCVEILSVAENVELDVKDSKGNSIYHMCAIYNHFESLRFLLTRKDVKFLEPLYIKNNNDDNVLHTACNHGHLEIIKLVMNKIYDGFSSTETYLLSKNKDGFTCFHIACIKGFYNIIEYFLKDLKMTFFLENLDNILNNPLHLASSNGHLSIVNILIEHGVDTSGKNKDGSTPLEISCRKGFFEISKMLIVCYSAGSSSADNYNEHPLHVACFEGAHEVVRLLLLKGAAIDVLNSQKKNCLDIAISQSHREVIRVLLQDPNWFKLINTANVEEEQQAQFHSVVYAKNRKLSKASVGLFKKPALVINKKENPQFLAM